MNATAREWIDKAEGDYRVAQRELAVVDHPNFDAVCYHAHQCIEKLMKALLIDRGTPPPRTHNLPWLGKLLDPQIAESQGMFDDLEFLTRAAGTFRYPGATARRNDASDALNRCKSLRTKLLNYFGITDSPTGGAIDHAKDPGEWQA